jgi:hypothetical protein
MQYTKDHKTGYLFDPFGHLGPKRRKLLEQSWAGVFREYLLNELPVEKIAKHFHPSMGRPSKELYTALGILILQQLHDLSDSEVVSTLAFDTRWQYALDITADSDGETTIAERTLREYRRIAVEEKLDGYLFETLTDKLIDAFDVDTSKQRIDSTHIRSNMRRLGRVGLFASTIRKFLSNLKRKYGELFSAQVPSELAERYLKKKGDSCFSQVKPSEARKSLKVVSEDLLFLVERFWGHQEVSSLYSFHLLQRVLQEQCTVSKRQGGEKKVEVKPPKEVPSDSLQNPSEPDATYDGYKGPGYKLQAMGTYTPDEQRDETKPDLLTYVELEQAHWSDQGGLIPAIRRTKKRGCAPEELQGDTPYGSDENLQEAAKLGVKVISPVGGKRSSKLGLERFCLCKRTGQVRVCPQGHKPEKRWRTKKGRFVARFSLQHCKSCPLSPECPVQLGKRGVYLRYSAKGVRLAERRAYQETEAFREKYRWRAGIEGTNSHLKSDTGAGRLRVRGFPAVRYCVILKALGLNILRATSAQIARLRAQGALVKGILPRISTFLRSKRRFKVFSPPIVGSFAQFRLSKSICPRWAA